MHCLRLSFKRLGMEASHAHEARRISVMKYFRDVVDSGSPSASGSPPYSTETFEWIAEKIATAI